MDVEKMIEELDTATGMLMVSAMKDPIVKAAMEKISAVSFQLGLMADESQ